MEFKGTKGKWEFSENGGVHVTTNSGMICDLITSSQKDKADALLISKAPEMLEMLKKLKDAMLELMEHQDGWEEDYDELEKLIKEATEL